MTEYFLNNNSNNSSSDSSIFRAIIREEELTEAQNINEMRRAANEFIKKTLLEQKVYAKINQEAYNEFIALLSQMELYTKNNESKISKEIWEAIYSWIEPILNMLRININPEINRLLLKKEKEKSWLFSIIKSLLAKLFKRNLSWEERFNKEIAELEEKLNSDGLSLEEMAKILERLAALHTMKLDFFKSQISAAWIILGVISMFLGYDLGVVRSTEIAHEKHEKIDKVKEPEVKQISENIKINENKELQQSVKDVKDIEKFLKNYKEIKDTEKLSDISSLLKEIDSRLLANLMRPILEANNEILNSIAKPEAEEKPKRTAPPTVAPQPKPPVKAPEMKFVQSPSVTLEYSYREKKDPGDPKVTSDKTAGRILKEKAQITKSTNERKTDNLCDDFLTQFTCAKEKNPNMNEQNVADAKLDNEKVPSELNEMKKVEHLSKPKNVSCGRSI